MKNKVFYLLVLLAGFSFYFAAAAISGEFVVIGGKMDIPINSIHLFNKSQYMLDFYLSTDNEHWQRLQLDANGDTVVAYWDTEDREIYKFYYIQIPHGNQRVHSKMRTNSRYKIFWHQDIISWKIYSYDNM